ncbi:hypothetical protein I41_08520 [Lacipirellula limnantheis]|uniref:PEP-CTERM protein-sorting domain-containing protein n=1 Tax=Lacipirellula limnantheis TaxID=2528024 RepID=A0A517TTK5_9BACT|nr:hypothetical protein I41_08520 [Lacipirellula limnantheis]
MIFQAVNKLLFVIFFLAASPFVTGAPLKYQFDFTVHRLGPSVFENAALRLDLTWDAAEFPPLLSTSKYTRWAVGNPSGSLAVTGSTGYDGVYEATFLAMGALDFWDVQDGGISADTQRVPPMSFDLNGRTATMRGLTVYFHDRSFFTAASPNSFIVPKPFSAAEADWSTTSFFVEGITSFVTDGLSASAREVPEPSTLALGSFALLPLAALRRRQ